MGHWSQNRKRGSLGHRLEGPQPPPPPNLEQISTVLVQTSTGAGNTGGQVALERSDDGLSDWQEVDTAGWAAIKDWGAGHPSYYRGIEIGNGTNYVGASQPSEVVHYALFAPTQPTLSLVEGYLHQVSGEADDTEGTLNLYYSTDGITPYTQLGTASWAAIKDWYDAGLNIAGFWRATEVGNGTQYSGESAPSNVVQII